MAEYIERAEVERVLMEKYNRFSGLRPDFYAGFMAAYKVIEQETESCEFAPENIVEQIKWERDKAIEQLESYGVGFCEDAEIKKIIHAEWVHKPNGIVDCSNCGCLAVSDCDFMVYVPSPYCPNCGATMKRFDHEKENKNNL